MRACVRACDAFESFYVHFLHFSNTHSGCASPGVALNLCILLLLFPFALELPTWFPGRARGSRRRVRSAAVAARALHQEEAASPLKPGHELRVLQIIHELQFSRLITHTHKHTHTRAGVGRDEIQQTHRQRQVRSPCAKGVHIAGGGRGQKGAEPVMWIGMSQVDLYSGLGQVCVSLRLWELTSSCPPCLFG